MVGDRAVCAQLAPSFAPADSARSARRGTWPAAARLRLPPARRPAVAEAAREPRCGARRDRAASPWRNPRPRLLRLVAASLGAIIRGRRADEDPTAAVHPRILSRPDRRLFDLRGDRARPHPHQPWRDVSRRADEPGRHRHPVRDDRCSSSSRGSTGRRGCTSRPAERRMRRATSGPQPRRLSGTTPPFSASLAITALCSAIFSSALPSAPAWTSSSFASSLRADKLASRSSSFSRSTIDVW